jgi:hypothetical protein
MRSEREARRRAIGLTALSLCLMLVAGGAAEAKKKGKKPKKPGPVVTRSATSTVAGKGLIATATATCPGKTKAVGGGYAATPSTNNGFMIVYESQKVGQNAWRASAQSFDFGAPDSVSITTHAYCRRRAPATTTAQLTVPTPALQLLGPIATANCPPNRRAVAGGFSTNPPINVNQISNLVTHSLPTGTGGWFSQVVSQASSAVTSYVYCARQKKGPSLATGAAPANAVAESGSTATASCTGKRVATSGGFSQLGIDADPGHYFFVYESQASGRDWRASGIRAGTAGVPVTLGSTAFCG